MRHLSGGLLALLFFIFSAFSQESSTGIPPNEGKTLGKELPDVFLVDSFGREFNLHSLKGKPLILSPIYTNCTSACPIITDSLKKVIPSLGKPGVDFWVLSFTFDPTDGQEDIKTFQEKHGLDGDGWKVVRVKSKEDLFRLVDAIDFRFMSIPETKDFVHPNLVVFISPDMKVKKYVYGVVFDSKEMRRALEYSLGKRDILEDFTRFLFFAGLMGVSLSGLYLVISSARLLHRRETKKTLHL
ncbi:MAG: SCO family protein [Aquificaceae bacterium]|uniref:SCO family protein n=1 Tax=Hydrogenobacter sp. Uz 6-8 TaxID=3384828 RepID=UPI0030A104A4